MRKSVTVSNKIGHEYAVIPSGRFATDYGTVTLSVEHLLDCLRPDGCFGGLVLRCYRRWLSNRQPFRFCDAKTAAHWREHQFNQVSNQLDYLSKIMLDKSDRW